jgi:integrase
VKTNVRGITYEDRGASYRGKRYLYTIRDRETGKEIAAGFDDKSAGMKWAEDKWANFTKGTERAGLVTLEQVKQEYHEYLKAGDLEANYVTEIIRLIDRAIAGGVRSLRDRAVSTLINKMLNEENERRIARVGRPQSISTRRRSALTFKTLGNWLMERDEAFPRNPFRGVKVPKKPALLPPTFRVEEAMKLASAARTSEDALMFVALLYTGCRQREVTWLRWSHINWQSNRIRIVLPDAVDAAEAKRLGLSPDRGKRVKGKRERVIVLEKELAELLRPRAALNDGYVFPDWARKLTRASMRRRFVKACTDAGFEKGGRRIHSLRATFASMLLGSGLDVIRLRNRLGHTSLEMTGHYANAAEDMAGECEKWGGVIRLASGGVSAKCPNSPPSHAQSSPVSDPEEDCSDDQELFVLVPDTSELYRESFLGLTGTDCAFAPRLGSSVARRAGSTPAVRTTLDDSELGEHPDLACPS